MAKKSIDQFITIKNLLFYLFCGAVVGETIALSMLITRLGPSIVGKLYLVNAVILLSVPPLFLRYIDKVDRGKLLERLLQGVFLLLTGLLVLYQLLNPFQSLNNAILILLYPIAYLSKTILFLTFWTFLNDIYTIQEAKKQFPIIAAWGFTGSLTGVIAGRILLAVVSPQTLIVLWIIVYVVAWYIAKKIGKRYKKRLRPVEDLPRVSKNYFGLGELLELRLVRIMSLFYFLTFIAVFLIDFLFWKKCYEWFVTAEKVASFQFSFYIGHALLTIIALRYALPAVIARVGFTRVLYGLPIMFSVGGIVLTGAEMKIAPGMEVIVFVTVLFFRYILFEIAFAPLYQLFFAAIVKERRGRAKTFLEGMIKPLAILTSGIILVSGIRSVIQLSFIISLCGVMLIVLVYYLRRVYRSTMISGSRTTPGIEELIEEAGQEEDDRLYMLINRYARSPEADMRTVAVHLMRQTGTNKAFQEMVRMYGIEKDERLREMIARSVDVFYGYTTRPFIEMLIETNDQRIKANAIWALNNMHCNWKRHLTTKIGPLLFENNVRVQIEAARFLWENGSIPERCSVQNFLSSLLDSNEPGRKSAGIYLAGSLRTDGWEEVLVANLHTASLQVFRRSVEVLLQNASVKIQLRVFETVDALSRKHITVTGEVIDGIGISIKDSLVTYLSSAKNRRMRFELVRCLTKVVEEMRQGGADISLSKESTMAINRWITPELEGVYREAFAFARLKNEKNEGIEKWDVLESALREKQFRVCRWALMAVILTDIKKIHSWRIGEMDIYNLGTREELIEIFESVSQEKRGVLIVGLLKQNSWENLAKIGKSRFYFNEKRKESIIAGFLKSENRLITLCTLYSIKKNTGSCKGTTEVREVLKMLSYHKNELIASAAIDLIDMEGEGRTGRGKAFQLLDSVLFFKNMELFNGIGADKILHLVEIAQLVTFRKEAVVSMRGRVADQMYIVKSGSLRIEAEHDGIKETVHTIPSGKTYGEVGLFSKTVRSVSAIADEDSEVYIVKGADIKRLVREVPEFAFNFLEKISRRLVKEGVEMKG